MRVRRSVVAPLLAAALVGTTVACTGDAESTPAATPPSQVATGSGPEPSAAPATEPSAPATQPSGTEPQATQPLVLVVHHSRPDRNLRPAAARRLVGGDRGAWPGRVRPRLVGAPGTPLPDRLEARSARAAVRAATRDVRVMAVVPASAVGAQVRALHVGGADPLTDPDAYPLQVPAAQEPGPVLTMSVVGDIMLGRGVAAAAAGSGDPAPALHPMQRRLAAADITVGNLENTLSRAGAPTQGDDSFAARPAVVPRLRQAGFDVLSLANNHLGDFGPRALVETVRTLRGGGIATFGAGAGSRQAWRPAVLERGGVRFGFLGFNAIGETPEVRRHRPGAVSVSMPPRTGPLDDAELGRFLRAVERLDRRVDVVVVMPHWGTQYTNRPEPVQHAVAARLVDAGADLVVGGHPHWVQGARMVRDRLVVHSLGNFVFDMDFMEETQRGVLLELTYWGDRLKAADFVPYQMDKSFAPRVEPRRASLDTLGLLWEFSGPAFAGR